MSHLILSRRPSESIIIADNIKVTVLGIKGNQVKIGVDLPKELSVWREEIWAKGQKKDES